MSNYQDKQKMTFWDFLTNYKIEIPIIQRDYAQGRIGKEYLRKSFLGDIKKALDNEPPFKDTEMKLDFVYGSIENGVLHPLDGQQRLTTLWLLHWYIALMAGKLKEASETLKRFSYETRISSRDFCENLCKPEYFSDYYWGSIVAFITSRTWFYSAWKQDPTIQAMLRMLGGSQNEKKAYNLDGIEQVFKCDCIRFNQCSYLYYWKKLSVNCPIGFYFLSLNEFKLTDDLYIKMNARGKQLTGFENFKADLIGYLVKQKNEISNPLDWEKLLDPSNGIPISVDTKWTNIFWQYKSVGIKDGNGYVRKAGHIDEIYFAFINRFFWNELFLAKDEDGEYILDLGDGVLEDGTKTRTVENENQSYRYLNREYHDEYLGFAPYLYYKDHKDHKDAKDEPMRIPISFFNDLTRVLDNHGEHLEIPECNWDNNNFEFIPKYDVINDSNDVIKQSGSKKTLKVSTLSQIQRIVFFAVCKYLKEGTPEGVSLKRWMRVIWNLVSGESGDGNYQIRNTEAMRRCMEFIGQLDSHNVYESFQAISSNQLPDSEFGKRCCEEIIKARWILYTKKYIYNNGKSWEDVIIESENHAFFKGSIRFLYQDAEGKVKWDDFDTKLVNVCAFFNEKSQVQRSTLERYINYLNDDDILYLGIKYGFSNKPSIWKSILLDQKLRKATHTFLMNQTGVINNSELKQQLLLVLNNISEDVWILQDWKTNKNVLTNYAVRRDNPNNGYVYPIGTRRHKIIRLLRDNGINVEIPDNSRGDEFYANGLSSVVCYRGLYATIYYNNCPIRYEGDDKLFLMDKNNPNVYLNDESTEKKLCCSITSNNEIDSIINQMCDLINKANDVNQ